MYRGRRVAIVVLARSGSRRLPGKVLLPFGEETVLASVLRRLAACARADELVLATSALAADDAVAREGERLGVRVVRGSEEDVVARMRLAVASLAQAPDVVVRACADNPLVMPGVVDEGVMDLVDAGADVITPFEVASWPFGAGAVAMTRACLERIDAEAREPAYREHVENWCFEAPEPFRVRHQVAPPELDFPELCLSLDHPTDLARLRRLERVLRGVPLAEQPRALVEHVSRARVWFEGMSGGRGVDWDLIVASDAEPLRSLAPHVPLGVVGVERFELPDGPRLGLAYVEDCGPDFPREPIFLDWRRATGGEGRRAFLARVRPLVWRLLLAGPARAAALQERPARADKAPRRERRAGFRQPAHEHFPPRVAVELGDDARSLALVRRLAAELRHEPFEELLVAGRADERSHALAALEACAEGRRVRRLPAGEDVREAPFETLAVDADGRMSILSGAGTAELGETGVAAFWRSPLARRARAHWLNAGGVRAAREVRGP